MPPDDKPTFTPPGPDRDPALAGIAYPESEESFLAAVQEGLDELDAGRTVPWEDVKRWMESWGTKTPLPPPECPE